MSAYPNGEQPFLKNLCKFKWTTLHKLKCEVPYAKNLQIEDAMDRNRNTAAFG